MEYPFNSHPLDFILELTGGCLFLSLLLIHDMTWAKPRPQFPHKLHEGHFLGSVILAYTSDELGELGRPTPQGGYCSPRKAVSIFTLVPLQLNF